MFAEPQSPEAFGDLGTANRDHQGDNRRGGQLNFPASGQWHQGPRSKFGRRNSIEQTWIDHTLCTKLSDQEQAVPKCKAEPGTHDSERHSMKERGPVQKELGGPCAGMALKRGLGMVSTDGVEGGNSKAMAENGKIRENIQGTWDIKGLQPGDYLSCCPGIM